MDLLGDDSDASGETDNEGVDNSYEAVIAENIVQPPTPAQTSFTIVRPTISNLLVSPNSPSLTRQLNTMIDPIVRTLGIASSLIHSPSPKKRARKPPIQPPPPSNQPFKLTYAHLKAYRKLQMRKPSSAITSDRDKGKGKGNAIKGKNRKMCIAEAAWKLWAEKGGLGKAGKEIRAKAGAGKEEGVGACMAYSYDENGKPYKPIISHVQIIRLVLAASMEKMMTLAQIYQAIEARWPYFKTCGSNWKGSIRHNLSHHNCFKQITRTDEHGHPIKGHWWQVDEELAGPLYPRKERPRKTDPTQPLLSTAPTHPTHPLHPSFATIDPQPPTSPNKNTFTPIPYIPGGTSTRSFKRQRTKSPVVHIPGKAPDFPLPGIPPHAGGVVPPGYPNPLPAGWRGGWGDPTLVDLGMRYGFTQDSHADIGVEDGGSINDSGDVLSREEGLNIFSPYPGASDASRDIPARTTTGFAPLSDFSTFLSQPVRPLSTCSSTSSLSSLCTASSRLTGSSTPFPPHLPFLNLLHPSPADLPLLPSSDYPLFPTPPNSAGYEPVLGLGPASTQLLKRGNGFVPPDVQAKWRKAARNMSPFPGSGEWTSPSRSSYLSVEGGLPGIEQVLGSDVRRGDPRLSVAVQRRRGGRST